MTGMAVLQYGNLRIDPNERRVYVNEQVVELTTMEFNILYYLALHPGWTFTFHSDYEWHLSLEQLHKLHQSPYPLHTSDWIFHEHESAYC